MDRVWNILSNDDITLKCFGKHPETRKLKPWVPAFWIAGSLSILNYPTDMFNYIRDGAINVHIADITHLSPQTVHLSNGASLNVDALICSIGWKHSPNIDFRPKGIDTKLGLPHKSALAEDILA